MLRKKSIPPIVLRTILCLSIRRLPSSPAIYQWSRSPRKRSLKKKMMRTRKKLLQICKGLRSSPNKETETRPNKSEKKGRRSSVPWKRRRKSKRSNLQSSSTRSRRISRRSRTPQIHWTRSRMWRFIDLLLLFFCLNVNIILLIYGGSGTNIWSEWLKKGQEGFQKITISISAKPFI